jgi:D-alanine transaminase
MAITTLDGKPVGTSTPGAMFATLHQLYQEYKQKIMRT